MRGQVPLQLIPGVATGWDRSISHRAEGVVEAVIPADENEETHLILHEQIGAGRAYAGMTASELNWLQSLTDFQWRPSSTDSVIILVDKIVFINCLARLHLRQPIFQAPE